MAVYKPPLGLPFVDQRFYVARPWVEWLIDLQTDVSDLGESSGEQVATNTINIAVNRVNITTLQAEMVEAQSDIVGLEAADIVLTASVLSNETLSYYFASL